jgi:hypothetical protein
MTLNNLLTDSCDGSLSSKRVITFFAFILCSMAFLSNLFWNFKIEEFMFNSMIYLVMVGLGVTASEKFVPLFKKTENKPKGIL